MKKQKLNQQWECIYFLQSGIISSAKFAYKENPSQPQLPEADKGKHEPLLGPLGDAVAKSGTVLGTAFSIMNAALEVNQESQLSVKDCIAKAVKFARAEETQKSTEAFREALEKADALSGKDKVMAYKNLSEAISGWYQAPDKLTTLQYLAGVASLTIDNMPLQDRIDAYESLLHIVTVLYNSGDHAYTPEDVFRKKYLVTADSMPNFDPRINAYKKIQEVAGSCGEWDIVSLAADRIKKTMEEKRAETQRIIDIIKSK